jgi:hypothetical protein
MQLIIAIRLNKTGGRVNVLKILESRCMLRIEMMLSYKVPHKFDIERLLIYFYSDKDRDGITLN